MIKYKKNSVVIRHKPRGSIDWQDEKIELLEGTIPLDVEYRIESLRGIEIIGGHSAFIAYIKAKRENLARAGYDPKIFNSWLIEQGFSKVLHMLVPIDESKEEK